MRWLPLVAMLSVLMLVGCKGESEKADKSPESNLGAKCTNSSDCSGGLKCGHETFARRVHGMQYDMKRTPPRTCVSRDTYDCQSTVVAGRDKLPRPNYQVRCGADGLCTAIDGKCVAGSNTDCKQSGDCKGEGKCTAKDGKCIATDTSCKQTSRCKRDGKCTAKDGVCVK